MLKPAIRLPSLESNILYAALNPSCETLLSDLNMIVIAFENVVAEGGRVVPQYLKHEKINL